MLWWLSPCEIMCSCWLCSGPPVLYEDQAYPLLDLHNILVQAG